MKLRKEVCLLFLGTWLLSACGGSASMGSPLPTSPSVSFSANTLNFSDDIIGDPTQPPQSVTLTNSGTASLSIASIDATSSFTQTNNCLATLAAGANCVINVTFTPISPGSVGGTLSVTDNAPGSPQIVALNGALTPGTLTGSCFYKQCTSPGTSAACVTGQQAVLPEYTSYCFNAHTGTTTLILVDASRNCLVSGQYLGGICVVTDVGAAASRTAVDPDEKQK